ncbi:MAG: ATP-binding protein [Planctomycetota bacterium]
MATHVVRSIAAPMIALSIVLLGVGVLAAWNVNRQQQETSDLVIREMRAMLMIEDLHIEMRDVRYNVNRFLRTDDPQALITALALREKTDPLLEKALSLARMGKERELVEIGGVGYERFFTKLNQLSKPIIAAYDPNVAAEPHRPASPEVVVAFTQLSDELLTHEVLQPLRKCLSFNQEVVERANEGHQRTAQHLKIGFLMLGICGSAAGLLTGTGIARAVGRSIVQLNISVRDVVGKLHDVREPVTISHDGGFVGIESDLKRLEDDIGEVVRRLQQRETELLRAEQLARVGQLAAGMAHELRNPLTPMKMLVQAALERGDESGLKGRALHVINDEISRLEKSIQTFLDFARPPVPEKSTVNVSDLIQQVFNLVSARATQQNVRINLDLPNDSVTAVIDTTQIRQLVLNLVLNSLDALPNGGEIAVKIEPARPAQTTSNKGVAITIRDNGAGIPEELMGTLFEPFVTTKETGTGLGLSICHRIATAHGGTLTVRNIEPHGAEFRLSLPFQPDA